MLNEALGRMPHAGRMRLIDEVAAADAEMIECRAADHSGPAYPLRVAGVLHAPALIELGAQAAAAHTSLCGTGAAHDGLVLALSRVEVLRDRVGDDGRLMVRAWRLQAQDDAASYRFEVSDGAGPVVTGEVLLSVRRRGA